MVRIDRNPPATPQSEEAASTPARRGAKSFGDLLNRAPTREWDDESGDDLATSTTEAPSRTQEKPSDRREASLSPTAKPGTRADVQNLLHKLVDSFQVGQNRSGAVEVRMELKNTVFDGMQIQLAQGPAGLKAILTVERYAAKGALERQMAELTKRLEIQGVKVSDIQVELASHAKDSGRDGSPEDGAESEEAAPVQPPLRPSAGRPDSQASRSIQSPTDYSL